MSALGERLPDELGLRRWGWRLVQGGALAGAVALVVLVGPGLGEVRRRLADGKLPWLVAAVAFELLSALAYVVIFRTVFCARMSRRLSLQIGLAEQAANSVLSVSGAGGLALGVWALRRAGLPTEHVARRTVAFFLLTSLANVGAVVVIAALYAVGLLSGDRDPVLTYGFGAAAFAGIALVLALPSVLERNPADPARLADGRRRARLVQFVRHSLAGGVRDGRGLLRTNPVGVLSGSVGTMAFDLAVLGSAFAAFGHEPALGVLALGYLIGQLGGNLPLPGGIGGVEAGLIGTFALYHEPLAVTTAAVLVYHAISLWVPAVIGSVAFVRLRRTLRTTLHPAANCVPVVLAPPAPQAGAGALPGASSLAA